MAGALTWALQIAAVVLLAVVATFLIRRPRLRVEVSMRGTTRTGKLYIVATNRGGLSARDAHVEAAWIAQDGRRAPIGRQALGTLRASDPLRVEIDQLHRGLDDPSCWEAIEVTLRAQYALPARARVELATRSAPRTNRDPAIHYVPGKDVVCSESANGAHDWERRSIQNDGVTETWDLCRRCRHVLRQPLSAEDQATQARVREERARRERAKMEEEFARQEREEAPRPRPAGRHTRRERAEPPARDDDLFPPVVAFYILELDPTSATWANVLAAHRRLALAHHPDRRADLDGEARKASERKMQEINAARDRLREHLGIA